MNKAPLPELRHTEHEQKAEQASERIRSDVHQRFEDFFEYIRTHERDDAHVGALDQQKFFPRAYWEWMQILDIDEPEDWGDPPKNKNASIFFEECVKCIRAHRAEEPKAVEILCQYVENHLLNEEIQHTELLSFCTTQDVIRHCVSLSEFPEIRNGSAGATTTLIQRLIHDFDPKRTPPSINEITDIFQEYIEQAPTKDQVAFFHYLPTLRVNSIWFEEEFEEDLDVEKDRNIFDQIRQKYVRGESLADVDLHSNNRGRVVEMAIALFIERTCKERSLHIFAQASAERAHKIALEKDEHAENPEYPIEDSDFGRMYEIEHADKHTIKQHSERLGLNELHEPNERLELKTKKIARDAFGFFDDTETVQYLMGGDLGQERQRPERAIQRLAPRTPPGTDREEQLTLLSEFYRPWMFSYIEQTFGVDLAQMSVREQLQFFTFLSESDAEKTKAAQSVTNTFGQDAARAFLSCEYGRQYGDDILKIAKQLPEPAARAIFRQYAEILDTLEQPIQEIIGTFFSNPDKKTTAGIAPDLIYEELLARAKEILHTFVERHAEKIEQDDVSAVIEELKRYSKDRLLFASVFRTAYKGKRSVPFEELKGVEIKERHARELDEEEKKQILLIADQNWAQSPIHDYALSSMEKKLDSNEASTTFHVLKKDQDVVAFLRLDQEGPHELYLGSVNVSPTLRGSALGGALVQTVLDNASATKSITAHADPSSDVLSSYIETHGFIMDRMDAIKTEGGTIDLVHIRKDPDQNYQSKDPHLSQIQLLAIQQNGSPAPFTIERYDLKQDPKAIEEAVKRQAQIGRVATRYLKVSGSPDQRIVVFEPLPSASDTSLAA